MLACARSSPDKINFCLNATGLYCNAARRGIVCVCVLVPDELISHCGAPMMTMVDDDGVPQQTIEYRTPHCVGVDQINHFCGCLCVCVRRTGICHNVYTHKSRSRGGGFFVFCLCVASVRLLVAAAAAVVAVFCESNSRARGWQVTMHFVCCVCSGIARARAHQPG